MYSVACVQLYFKRVFCSNSKMLYILLKLRNQFSGSVVLFVFLFVLFRFFVERIVCSARLHVKLLQFHRNDYNRSTVNQNAFGASPYCLMHFSIIRSISKAFTSCHNEVRESIVLVTIVLCLFFFFLSLHLFILANVTVRNATIFHTAKPMWKSFMFTIVFN